MSRRKDSTVVSTSQRIFKVLPWIGVVLGVLFLLFTAGGGKKDKTGTVFVDSKGVEYLSQETITVRPGELSKVIEYVPGKVLETGVPTACVETIATGRRGTKTFVNCPGDPYRDLDKELGKLRTIQFKGLKVPAQISVRIHK